MPISVHEINLSFCLTFYKSFLYSPMFPFCHATFSLSFTGGLAAAACLPAILPTKRFTQFQSLD